MFEILCLSDCCCDLIFQGMARIPEPGTEEYCQELHLKAGGGANTPMGLAKLGCSTAYAATLGTDLMGAAVEQELLDAGVFGDWLRKPQGAHTWVSAVLSTKEDRAFASYAGASADYTRTELEQMVRSAKWVHTYAYYCDKYSQLPEICCEAGVPLSIDAAYDGSNTLADLEPLLRKVTLFTPNDTEARGLTGKEQPLDALKCLASICPNVIVTMGPKGCLASLEGDCYSVTPPKVQAVDATGAGDLFNAGYLAARLQGLTPEECLRWAAASGALAVTYPGGMNAKYTQEKVIELAKEVQLVRI